MIDSKLWSRLENSPDLYKNELDSSYQSSLQIWDYLSLFEGIDEGDSSPSLKAVTILSKKGKFICYEGIIKKERN